MTTHRFHPVVRLALLLALTSAFGSVACVDVDARTGQALPRGKQRYLFAEVRQRAGELQLGMSRRAVLLLLGAPAETSEDGDTWIYLPERQAYLVPAKMLKVRFEGPVVAAHGYHAIVLGQTL